MNRLHVRVTTALVWLCALLLPSLATAQPPPEADEFSITGDGDGDGDRPSALRNPGGGQGPASGAATDPGRVIAQRFATVGTSLRTLCDSDAPPKLVTGSSETISAEPWKATCARYCGDTAKIDVCAFSDPVLARVAATTARRDVRAIIGQLEPVRVEADGLSPTASLTLDGTALVAMSRAINSIRQSPDSSLIAGALGATGGMEIIQRFLGGLAKVIADRAKREAIAWLLEKTGEELCGTGGALGKDRARLLAALSTDKQERAKLDKTHSDRQLIALGLRRLREAGGDATIEVSAELRAFFGKPHLIVQTEIREHWLPNLCALTQEDQLDHYGAGAALLEAIRGALEADIAGWPGVAAGIALSESHWSVVSPGQPPALLACHDPGNRDEGCGEVARLRYAGERFIERLLDHADPLVAMRTLGTTAGREAIRSGVVADVPLAMMSCGLSLPAELVYYSPRFDGAPRGSYTTILTGVVVAPACWTLVGQGYAGVEADGDLIAAAANANIERLSTIVRIDRVAGAPLENLGIEVNAVRAAAAGLTDARTKLDLDLEQRAQLQWQAGIALIDAGLSLADSVLMSVEDLDSPEVLFASLSGAKPPTGEGIESAPDDVAALVSTQLAAAIADTRERVSRLRSSIAIASNVAIGDFGQAVAVATAEITAGLEKLCAASADGVECRARLGVVGRHSGTIAAILSARTTEEMAQAISAAANPPGGWRTKLAKGNLTVSLVAYPGGFGGAEFRWGPYGAVYEQGTPVYGQAPTLAMPFGIDIVRGRGKWACGWFLSVIDPVAFLQYDLANEGRLPGPRPVTVLAPGLYWRANLGKSPIVAMIGATFRPQFRTWGATVSGPGANALQIGASLGVDVTMWKLFAKGK